MKTITKFLFIVALFLVTSCDQDTLQDIAGNYGVKSFDMDLFEANIQGILEGEAVGYCYVIAKDGQEARSGAAGKRRQNADGAANQSIHEPMYLASISKNVTAIAALKLMDELNISVNDPFFPYLPDQWVVHPSIEELTFRHLMQHKSGFQNGGASYNSLKSYIEQGVNLNDTVPNYQNSNFAMFRIIIPYLIGPIAGSDSFLDNATSTIYRDYIKNNLFAPLGITNTDTKPVGNNPTLYYQFGDSPNVPGWSIGDRTNISGGGGWYLSPYDLMNFFAHVEFTEQIISNEVREQRDDLYLGWDQGSSESGNNDYGVYHAKNGALTNNDTDQGVRTLYKKFNKNGVQVVIMANSRGGAFNPINGSATLNWDVRDAYDDAWTE